MAKTKKEKNFITTHKISSFIVEYYSSIDKYLLLFYDKTNYWTNSFKVIRQEKEMQDFIKYNREDFIEDYFDGNLVRFLRKHRKQYNYQLNYYRTFRKWKKKKKTNKARRRIIKFCEGLPGEVNKVTNILLTMNKDYDWDIDENNAIIACEIYITFANDIKEYNFVRNSKRIRPFKLSCTRKQAIKEQKARGFVKRKHFPDYNPNFSHVISIADRNYIYPYNILSLPIKKQVLLEAQKENDKNILFRTIYRGLSSIGVEGYTAIVRPD